MCSEGGSCKSPKISAFERFIACLKQPRVLALMHGLLCNEHVPIVLSVSHSFRNRSLSSDFDEPLLAKHFLRRICLFLAAGVGPHVPYATEMMIRAVIVLALVLGIAQADLRVTQPVQGAVCKTGGICSIRWTLTGSTSGLVTIT